MTTKEMSMTVCKHPSDAIEQTENGGHCTLCGAIFGERGAILNKVEGVADHINEKFDFVHCVDDRTDDERYELADLTIVTRRQYITAEIRRVIENVGVSINEWDSFGANGHIRLHVTVD